MARRITKNGGLEMITDRELEELEAVSDRLLQSIFEGGDDEIEKVQKVRFFFLLPKLIGAYKFWKQEAEYWKREAESRGELLDEIIREARR